MVGAIQEERMLIQIKGGHGAGKSTLARNILGPKWTEEPLVTYPHEYTHRVEDKPIVASVRPDGVALLGPYQNKCGGGDAYSQKGVHDYLETAILKGAQDYRHFIFEGAIISNVSGRYIRVSEAALALGIPVVWVFLHLTPEQCIANVCARNGKTQDQLARNGENVIVKAEQQAKEISKMREHPGIEVVELTDMKDYLPYMEKLLGDA